MNQLYFNNTLDSFYKSLSKSIENKIKELSLKQNEIIPHNPKRVSEIVNCIRSKKHPYLIGTKEYRYFGKLFEYRNLSSYTAYLLDLNDDDYYKEKEVYSLNNNSGKNEINKVKKFVDDKNYDNILWDHIDWEQMYRQIIQDLIIGNASEKIRKNFYENLIDYVPYSKLHFYNTTEFAKVWNQYGNREKDEITNKAIEWCYLDSISEYSKKLKKEFYEQFSGKKLDKFDEKFIRFSNNFLDYFFKELKPSDNSFGLQALKYQNNIAVHINMLHTNDKWNYEKEETEETALIQEFIDYSQIHVDKLSVFQEEFKKIKLIKT